MMDWQKDKNIFKYEEGEYDIFYSPIARCMVLSRKDCDINVEHEDVFKSLTDYVPINQQKKVKSPEDYTLLTVLPNNTCNFTCSYCYSAFGRNRSVLARQKLFTAIEYFITSKPYGFAKPLSISFMGGGEPMLSWDNVKAGISYAEELASQHDVRLHVSIITNGSLLTQEIMAFLIGHNVNVSVSFEIIPEVQNAQRKNYNLVKDNITRLCQAGIPVQINSTITPMNVDRMKDMLAIAIQDFPQARNLMFEPATGEGLYSSPEELGLFYQTYISQFHECLTIADAHKISLSSFAYLRTIFPLERACPGEFCITADGFITGCYCVGSPKESLFARTQYGTVEEGKIVFDYEKYHALINENVYSKEECAGCKVRWNCGGGCFHQYNSYSQEYKKEVCDFTRDFVEMIVRYRAERYIKCHSPITCPKLIKIS